MNIAIVILDCLRADHTSCYGYKRPTTPELDAFAAGATRFATDVSAGVWTLPSMTSLLTGRYPSQHGVNRADRRLDPAVATLAERLRDAGYRTAGFSANPYVGRTFGLDRGFETFGEFWSVSGGGQRAAGGGAVDRAYRALLPRLRTTVKRSQFATRAFMRYQRRRAAHGDKSGRAMAEAAARWAQDARSGSRPFFVLMHFMEAHTPLAPPPAHASRFMTQTTFRRAQQVDQDGMAFMAGANALGADDLALLGDLYDASISYGDELLGVVLRALGDDTLVVITADHGNHFGDHGIMGHFFSVYDTLSHVPLVVRHPALPAGSVVEREVQSIDILPTVLEAAGLDAAGLPGVPLTAAIDPRACRVSEYLSPDLSRFGRFRGFDPSAYDRELRSLRRDGCKYIWGSDGHEELYRLATDPGERNDLAAREPELVQEFRALHKSWLAESQQSDTPAPVAAPSQDLDMEPSVAASLRALGYFD